MSNLYTFIHNDISWCYDSKDCEHKDCFRHLSNRIKENEPDIFTMSSFKNTEFCEYKED